MRPSDRGRKQRIVGYPALIFMELQNYGKIGQEPDDRNRILFKIESYIHAYLPVFLKNPLTPEAKEIHSEVFNVLIPKLDKIIESFDLINENKRDMCQDPESIKEFYRRFNPMLKERFLSINQILAVSGVINEIELPENEDEIG